MRNFFTKALSMMLQTSLHGRKFILKNSLRVVSVCLYSSIMTQTAMQWERTAFIRRMQGLSPS